MKFSFTVDDSEQGSKAWRLARCGRVTASRAKDVLATIKSGEAASRRDYRLQLVCERLTGTPQDDVFINDDMKRGTELEPYARAAYEALTGRWVNTVGFLAHNDLMAGGSPDGVIGDYDGLIEIKVPRPANHLRYLRAWGVPKEHDAQVQHLLWLTGASWLDFVSYCPALPSHLQLYVQRTVAEPAELARYEAAVQAFLAEVDDTVRELTALSEAR